MEKRKFCDSLHHQVLLEDTKVVCVCFLLKREKLVGKKDERTTNEKRFFHPQKTILQKLCYCTAFLKRESLFYAVVKKEKKNVNFHQIGQFIKARDLAFRVRNGTQPFNSYLAKAACAIIKNLTSLVVKLH